MPGLRQAPSALLPSRLTAEGGGSQDHYHKPEPPLQWSSAAAGTISQALYPTAQGPPSASTISTQTPSTLRPSSALSRGPQNPVSTGKQV